MNRINISFFEGMFVLIICVTFFAEIMFVFDFPDDFYNFFSCTALVAGTYFSGKRAAFIKRKQGLKTGLYYGFLIFTVMLTVNIFISGPPTLKAVLIKFLISLISGGIGGVTGVNMRINMLPKKKNY